MSPQERLAAFLPEPSSTFLAGLRQETPQAWERLVEWYAPIVARWCRRAGLHGPDGEDVLQEVFVAIQRGIANFRREGGSFHAWASTITRNKILDHFRRQAHAIQAKGGSTAQDCLNQMPDAVDDPSSVVSSGEALLVRRVLDWLQPQFAETTWQAFWAVVVDGRSIADVAADLGLSANAVRIAKSRVLGRLRQELEELLEPGMSGPAAS